MPFQLDAGAAIFYERFQGSQGLKDRYFIVVHNAAPFVECFTTTTVDHAKLKPNLCAEFCEIAAGECCLPKRCFVDFRNIYPFDDIQLGSYLGSKRVRYVGALPAPVLSRIRDALQSCRSLSSIQKERLLESLTHSLRDG